MKYEKRITIYLDILGYKDWVDFTVNRNNRDNEKMVSYLNLQYKRIKKAFKQKYHTVAKRAPWIIHPEIDSKIVTVFSDSIVISLKSDEGEAMWHTIIRLYGLLKDMIYTSDYLFRGGISYGKLIHTNSTLFGPALINAYELESKYAQYPRVIIDEACVKLLKKRKYSHLTNPLYDFGLDELISQDDDGFYFIDYFSITPDFFNSFDIFYLKRLRERICDGLEEAEELNNNRIYLKYKWMAEKFNKALAPHKGKSVKLYSFGKKMITLDIDEIKTAANRSIYRKPGATGQFSPSNSNQHP